MRLWERIKNWINRNKKEILLCTGGVIVLGIGYVLLDDKKIPFSEWLETASKKELEDAYEKLRLDFCKTGYRTHDMEQIGRELEKRSAKEWFAKHPPSTDPYYRWTDANRWDRD